MMCSFGLKGTADPLLCQDPMSVLPTYASLMDSDVGLDFSEGEVMKASQLFGLYLLNADAKSNANKLQASSIKKEPTSNEAGKQAGKEKEVENPINGENKTCNSDALFEGMPFVELKTREVGPCAYCNMWRSVKFLSYCGKFPFCSVSCTKKFAVYKRERGELSETPSCDVKHESKLEVPTLFEQHKPKPFFLSHKKLSPLPKSKITGARISYPGFAHNASGAILPFDWSSYLEAEESEAAPIRCFRHAPLNTEWKTTLMGAMLEVHNRDPAESSDTYWVARIIQVAGYRARLRFEGYGIDSDDDFWIHLCTTESYPINGALRVGKKLKPPKGVMERLGDTWQEHISRVAHAGSLTISVPIEKVKQGLSCPFKKGQRLEVVYKKQLSNTCIATITNVVADRIHVQYEDCKDPSKDFWFHYTSPWIHPVGWSQRVGHPIIASAAYKSEALDKGRHQKGGDRDAPWDIFTLPQPLNDHGFQVGMKLEVIDPLKLGNVCAATVMEVLEEGYLMVAIEGCLDDRSSWFCHHVTSPMLLPVGFCDYNQIRIIPPRGYELNFDWDDYLKDTHSISAPVELFHQKKLDRGFRVGQKVEAVDLIESGLICVGTIVKIAGHLLRVHFDGWASSFDQWMDSESPDIYPVGWCEMVGYPLQAPKLPEPTIKPINVNQEKSFKKRSRHSSSSEKKRRLENGIPLSNHGSSSSHTDGSSKDRPSFTKEDTSITVPNNMDGNQRVPPLHNYTTIPNFTSDHSKGRSITDGRKQTQDSLYSFDNIDAISMPVPSKKKFKTLSSASTYSHLPKEKKKKLKKSKKEKREKRKEKKKKDKKRSKMKKKKEKREMNLNHIDVEGMSPTSQISIKKSSSTFIPDLKLSHKWSGQHMQSETQGLKFTSSDRPNGSKSLHHSTTETSTSSPLRITGVNSTVVVPNLSLKSLPKVEYITKARRITFDEPSVNTFKAVTPSKPFIKTERPLPSLTKITQHSHEIPLNKKKIALEKERFAGNHLIRDGGDQNIKNPKIDLSAKEISSQKDPSLPKKSAHDSGPMFFKKRSNHKSQLKTHKAVKLDELSASDPYSLEAEFPSTAQFSSIVKTEPIEKLAKPSGKEASPSSKCEIEVSKILHIPPQGSQKSSSVTSLVNLNEHKRVVNVNYVDLNILSKGMKDTKTNLHKIPQQVSVYGWDIDSSRAGMVSVIPAPQYSVLDSPISSSSSNGNASGSVQKMEIQSPHPFSPSSQKVDIGSLPTPSSSNGGNSTNSSPQKLPECEEPHQFDDGAVEDLLTIIEKDLQDSQSRQSNVVGELGGHLSDDAVAKDFITKQSPVKGQTELDADKQVEEILQAIRARSITQDSQPKSVDSVTNVQEAMIVAEKQTTAKKKGRARNKSSEKPQPAKKRRKSQLADLLQSPGKLDLTNIDPAFYMEGGYGKGDEAVSPVPRVAHPASHKESDPTVDDPAKVNSSVLVGMLNGVRAVPNPTQSLADADKKAVHQLLYDPGSGIKRPTNLPFPAESMTGNHFASGKGIPLAPFQPPASPTVSSSLLTELVKPPKASPNGAAASPVLNMTLQNARLIQGMVAGQRSPFRPVSFDSLHRPQQFSLPSVSPQEQLPLASLPGMPSQRLPWFRPEQIRQGSVSPNAALAVRGAASLPPQVIQTGTIPQRALSPASMPSSPVNVNPLRGPSIRNISPKLPSSGQSTTVDQHLPQHFRMPLTFQTSNHSTPQRLPPMQTLLKRSPITSNPPSPSLPGLQLSPHPVGNSPGPLSPGMMASPTFPRPPSHLGNPMSPPQMVSSGVFVAESQPEPKKKRRQSSQAVSEAVPKSPLNEALLTNPWTWSVADVVQFLHDSGEGGCADTFYRQQINGQRLMSLNKEQIVKLTGVKVASSLKIYQQMLKLHSMFPKPDGPRPNGPIPDGSTLTSSPGSLQDGP